MLCFLMTKYKMCNFFKSLFTASVWFISEQPSYYTFWRPCFIVMWLCKVLNDVHVQLTLDPAGPCKDVQSEHVSFLLRKLIMVHLCWDCVWNNWSWLSTGVYSHMGLFPLKQRRPYSLWSRHFSSFKLQELSFLIECNASFPYISHTDCWRNLCVDERKRWQVYSVRLIQTLYLNNKLYSFKMAQNGIPVIRLFVHFEDIS